MCCWKKLTTSNDNPNLRVTHWTVVLEEYLVQQNSSKIELMRTCCLVWKILFPLGIAMLDKECVHCQTVV